jgi:hypothetical protein
MGDSALALVIGLDTARSIKDIGRAMKEPPSHAAKKRSKDDRSHKASPQPRTWMLRFRFHVLDFPFKRFDAISQLITRGTRLGGRYCSTHRRLTMIGAYRSRWDFAHVARIALVPKHHRAGMSRLPRDVGSYLLGRDASRKVRIYLP